MSRRAAAPPGACSIIESGPAGAVVRVAGATSKVARGGRRAGARRRAARPAASTAPHRALVHCERVALRGGRCFEAPRPPDLELRWTERRAALRAGAATTCYRGSTAPRTARR